MGRQSEQGSASPLVRGAATAIAAAAGARGESFPCKVRAKKPAWFGMRRVRPGDVFTVQTASEFSARWMERVPDETPDVRQSTADLARAAMAAQLSGRAGLVRPKLQPNAADVVEPDETGARHADDVLT